MLDVRLATQPAQKPQRPAAPPQPAAQADNVTSEPTDEKSAQPDKPDDLSIAEDLAEAWNGKQRFFFQEWHTYTGNYWKKRQDGYIRADVGQFLKQYRSRGVQVNSGRINGVTKVAQDYCLVGDDVILAAAPERQRFINHQGGMYDLELHHTEAARPELYFTYQLPFKHDPLAKCPHFDEYLRTTFVYPNTTTPDPEMAWLVLEAIGYSLTSWTGLKSAFWLIGESHTGKSTLLWLLDQIANPVFAGLNMNELNDRFMLASIIGKRIVVCAEADANGVLADGVFKTLTGGEDKITTDVKHKDPITFKPESHLWWAMNTPPRIKDRSNAVYNRLKIIRFNHVFEVNDAITEHLKGELAGIFNLAMLGYRRLRKNGKFTEPQQSLAKLKELHDMEDNEAAFLKECCIREPEAKEKSFQLYAHYSSWCERGNIRGVKTVTQIAKDWRRLGLTLIEANDGNYWKGVRINPFF